MVEAMASLRNDGPRGTELKMSMLRRKLAQRLVSVKNETAMLTTFNEVDMSAIFAIEKNTKKPLKISTMCLGSCPFLPKL